MRVLRQAALCCLLTCVVAPAAWAAQITVTSPNTPGNIPSGRYVLLGLSPTAPTVTWTSTGIAHVKIDLYKGGVFYRTMSASTPAANGRFTGWGYAPGNGHALGGDFRIRVSAVENPAIFDINDRDFTITTSPWNLTLMLRASVQASPKAIVVSWDYDTGTTDLDPAYEIRRRILGQTGAWSTLSSTVKGTRYADTTAVPGVSYEYTVTQMPNSWRSGEIAAGLDLAMADYRGTVLLLVDQTLAAGLAAKLERHQSLLVGDGWQVVRRDVPRKVVGEAGWAEAVRATKAEILAVRAAYPDLAAVSIIGHVPVPYSGVIVPDGHTQSNTPGGSHRGAWPADGYYGDINGIWADGSENATEPPDPRNWNIQGDGKFSQSAFTSDVVLAVGRVDFRDMPAFSKSESELLSAYLDKVAAYRLGQYNHVKAAIFDDNFFNSDSITGPHLGSVLPMVIPGDWWSIPAGSVYSFATAFAGSTFDFNQAIGTTGNFVGLQSRAFHNVLMGSYLGDWDSRNNLMRATLAGSHGLTCVWGGRPTRYHHMLGIGATFGDATRYAMNRPRGYDHNTGIHWSDWYSRGVHIGLMGDPTLRLHQVRPPTNVTATRTGAACQISWTASPEAGLAGYHVYRGNSTAGPFTRLSGVAASPTNRTGSPVTDTVFTDTAAPSMATYMVRAVTIENGGFPGGATYINLSQGAFAVTQAPPNIAPTIRLTSPATGATGNAPASFTLSANAVDADGTITKVEFFQNGTLVATDTAAPYAATVSNLAAGAYSFTAKATDNRGATSTSIPVSVSVTAMLESRPYGGTARTLPGTVEAEDYDTGGEGLAYHDIDRGNNGNGYRTDHVDIAACSEGGFVVGWMHAGEWLNYTVNVATAGSYLLEMRVASAGNGGTCHVEFGSTRTGTLTVPNTGGWQTYQTISTTVTLPPGQQLMKLVLDTNGSTSSFGNVNWIRISPATVLVGNWTLDESPGVSTVSDSSGRGNNGTISSMSLSARAPAVLGNGLFFDGDNDVMTVPNSPSLEIGKDNADFSVMFWMRLDAGFNGTWRNIMQKGAGPWERTFSFFMEPRSNRLHYSVNAVNAPYYGANRSTEAQLIIGRWVHVALVKKGRVNSLYLNGSLDSQLTLPGPVVANSGPLYIGRPPYNATGSPNATFGLDSLRVYAGAVTPDLIAAEATRHNFSKDEPLGSSDSNVQSSPKAEDGGGCGSGALAMALLALAAFAVRLRPGSSSDARQHFWQPRTTKRSPQQVS